MYHLFADGSGNPSTRRSGWGFILHSRDGEIIKGCDYEHTLSTNKMELLAVLNGLALLPTDVCCKVTVYTDSLYVLMGRFASPKKHQNVYELWLLLKEYTSRHDIDFIKVGSGNQHPIHKKAHNLAREAVFNGLRITPHLSTGTDNACRSEIRNEGSTIDYSIPH